MQMALLAFESDTLEILQSRLSAPLTIELKTIDGILCRDGFELSVQASDFHACAPRRLCGPYRKVEVMARRGTLPRRYLGDNDESGGDDYAIYRYVPIETVVNVIDAHGGISN